MKLHVDSRILYKAASVLISIQFKQRNTNNNNNNNNNNNRGLNSLAQSPEINRLQNLESKNTQQLAFSSICLLLPNILVKFRVLSLPLTRYSLAVSNDLYSQVQHSYLSILSTQCLNAFRMIPKINSHSFPIQHSQTGFITEANCALCEVRTKSLCRMFCAMLLTELCNQCFFCGPDKGSFLHFCLRYIYI